MMIYSPDKDQSHDEYTLARPGLFATQYSKPHQRIGHGSDDASVMHAVLTSIVNKTLMVNMLLCPIVVSSFFLSLSLIMHAVGRYRLPRI